MHFSSNYERLPHNDEHDNVSPRSPTRPFPPGPPITASPAIPNSPPPSFRSRVSSRRNSDQHGGHDDDADRHIDDAFAAPSDDESDDEHVDESARRLVRSRPSGQSSASGGQSESDDSSPTERHFDRRVTEINMFMPGGSGARTGRVYGGGNGTQDGVFANLSAKPTRGEQEEEKPPTYEQAAADATPPYWETTLLAPGQFNSDDVFVDGLLVGSLFSFVWNALISMSFQFIGFLLTYLLHTTHAAKHGSRAGLGITLIQYGFTFRAGSTESPTVPGQPNDDVPGGVPADPNSHNFDSGNVGGGDVGGISTGITTSDWVSYVLMIVGWFILIRAVSDFIRARRQEQIVRSSPDRGLGVAVVASNEHPETAV